MGLREDLGPRGNHGFKAQILGVSCRFSRKPIGGKHGGVGLHPFTLNGKPHNGPSPSRVGMFHKSTTKKALSNRLGEACCGCRGDIEVHETNIDLFSHGFVSSRQVVTQILLKLTSLRPQLLPTSANSPGKQITQNISKPIKTWNHCASCLDPEFAHLCGSGGSVSCQVFPGS